MVTSDGPIYVAGGKIAKITQSGTRCSPPFKSAKKTGAVANSRTAQFQPTEFLPSHTKRMQRILRLYCRNCALLMLGCLNANAFKQLVNDAVEERGRGVSTPVNNQGYGEW